MDIWSRVANSDEVQLLLEISSLTRHLTDARVIAVLVVMLYLYLWVKLESIAATRRVTELRQAQLTHDCLDRPNLGEWIDKINGELFGEYTFFDAFLHVISKGKHPIRMHASCSMKSEGVVWKTERFTVHALSTKSSDYEEARRKSIKTPAEAFHAIRLGGKLSVLDSEISRKFQQVNFYVNCDDPDSFLGFFENETLTKRLHFVSIGALLAASFDFASKEVTIKSERGSVILKDFSDDHFHSLAIVISHTGLN